MKQDKLNLEIRKSGRKIVWILNEKDKYEVLIESSSCKDTEFYSPNLYKLLTKHIVSEERREILFEIWMEAISKITKGGE